MDIITFYHLSPGEFEKIFGRWDERIQAEKHLGWEQTRMQCYYVVKPYMKDNVSVKAFMPFPWEETKDKSKRTKAKLHDKKRFEMLKNKYGERL